MSSSNNLSLSKKSKNFPTKEGKTSIELVQGLVDEEWFEKERDKNEAEYYRNVERGRALVELALAFNS